MLFNRIIEIIDPAGLHGLGFHDQRFPAVGFPAAGADLDQVAQLPDRLSRSLPLGLVHYEDIPYLHDAGLDRLDIVAHSRHGHQDRAVGAVGDLNFVLPDPHRLDDDDVLAHGVQDRHHVIGGAGNAAEVAAGRQAPDEDAGIEEVALHPNAVPEDGPAAEGTGGIHGENPDRFLLLAVPERELVHKRAFPDPGRSGEADDVGLAGVRIEFPQDLPGRG